LHFCNQEETTTYNENIGIGEIFEEDKREETSEEKG
jgi:hypothetical protein